MAWPHFDDIFVWLYGDPDGQFQPAINSGIEGLINGDDTSTTWQQIVNGLGKVVDYYRTGAGRTSTNRTLGRLTAFWSEKHFVLLGDGTATL